MSGSSRKRRLTRREALKVLGGSAVGGVLAACAPTPATPEVIKETVEVPVEVPVKETVVVTPTPVPEVVKPFAGKIARVMMVGLPMMELIKEMAPAHEEETGLRVILETYGFDVLQQRLDLELSTGSGAYDVVQMVMIFIGRVIEAGWATDLMPLIEAEDYDLSDFVPGTINMFKRDEGLYALPWVPDGMGVVYRKDLFDAAGVSAFPETFEELLEVAPKIHSDEVVFTTSENNWHWIWPLYLQSYGGNFFVDPPGDLTPTFNTPEAIESAKVMVELFSKYSYPDAVSVGIPEAGTGLAQGTAACGISGLGVLGQALNPEVSTVLDKLAFAPVPKGPAGWFPQLAMHGYMIPAGCQQPEIAWEAIKWMVSPEVSRRFALEFNFFARNRYSVLEDPEVKEKFIMSGTDPLQVLADSMARAGAGYMVYRTVPPFRAVGAEIIRAFGEMITGQKSVEVALDDLQKNATDALIQAGYL